MNYTNMYGDAINAKVLVAFDVWLWWQVACGSVGGDEGGTFPPLNTYGFLCTHKINIRIRMGTTNSITGRKVIRSTL